MESEAQLCAGSKPSSVTVNTGSLLRARGQIRSQSQAGSPRAPFWARSSSWPTLTISLKHCLTGLVRHFADNTAINLTLEHQGDSDKLHRDLDRLQTWEARWDMEFNPSKCKVVRVTSSRDPLQTQYILHGQVLEAVSSARYLGWISPATSSGTLMWIDRSLGFIRRNVKTKSPQILEWHINPLFVPSWSMLQQFGTTILMN